MNGITDFSPVSVSQKIIEIQKGPIDFFMSDQEAMRFALSILDLTTLEGRDTNIDIKKLCQTAMSYAMIGFPNVAAVCVYPVFVRQAKSQLQNTDIKVASVAGAFPSGQSPLHVKLTEVKFAVDEGADEIDMVISRGKFLEGDYKHVTEEIKAIKEICKSLHLKVILETGELNDLNEVYKASVIAIEAGADFIKTSTGKISPAATLESSYVMLQAIKDHYNKTGKQIGFKPAGGISTPEQAYNYLKLVDSVLGSEWMTKDLFRIGASRLANNLAEYLKNSKS